MNLRFLEFSANSVNHGRLKLVKYSLDLGIQTQDDQDYAVNIIVIDIFFSILN